MAKQNATRNHNPKRILFVSGREIDYTRNDVIIRALSQIGNVDVVGATGPGSILWRSVLFAIKALWLNLIQTYDVIVVGFFGHLLMIPLGLLTRTPILFDAFLSTYDTLCEDRHRFSGTSIPGRMAFLLDKTACTLASAVLLDTPLHSQYFSKTFGIPSEKLFSLPVGCNEQIFHPQTVPKTETGKTTVLFYGSYLPLHGTDVIVKAASLLQDIPIRFEMIGRGQTFEDTLSLTRKLGLKNVDFLPPMPPKMLAKHIAVADICLGGHFGVSQKAARVVPGKIYQMLAMRCPVIAASSPANLAILTNEKNAQLCPANDPYLLSQAILKLHLNALYRASLGENGYLLYKQLFSNQIISKQLEQIIDTMMLYSQS